MLGSDAFGDEGADLLTSEGLPASLLMRTSEVPTGAALIAVDSRGLNQISIAPGANSLLQADMVPSAVIASASVLLCQLECPVEVFALLAPAIRASGGTTVLNPAPAQPLDAAILRLCDFVIPNEVELASLTGLPADDDAQVMEAALRLVELGAGNVIATLGSRGALWTDGAHARRYHTPTVSVIDTTGAGDAFCAGLAAALCAGSDLDDAIGQGVRAGAFCVTRLGVLDGLGRPEQLASLPAAEPSWNLVLPVAHA
jgi:ribokinase